MADDFIVGIIECSKCKDPLSFRVTRDVNEHPNSDEWFSEVAVKSLRQNKIRKTGVQVMCDSCGNVLGKEVNEIGKPALELRPGSLVFDKL
ncbi:hypothetical protein BSL78_24132 [Apostichopus japonicus]|uniref:Uncharacterized protein n=1 Tax=Stichopus japonicus TaxID=307972 RepID=A0A2G8JTH3_STIJA|nr:hypothetical protein BSL78_24132 [Apostichopus japonicus]